MPLGIHWLGLVSGRRHRPPNVDIKARKGWRIDGGRARRRQWLESPLIEVKYAGVVLKPALEVSTLTKTPLPPGYCCQAVFPGIVEPLPILMLLMSTPLWLEV